MLCEKCGKNEATFYYKENINGMEKAYHLCADCAKKLEESGEIRSFDGNFFDSMNKIFSGDNLFGSLFAPIGQRHALGAGNREKKTCPLCGSTFEDIVENGKLGCPMCYEVFGDALPATIQRIHGRTKHTGNVPKRFRAALEAKEKLQKLEDELHEAVKNEEYEKAAELRDAIRALKNPAPAVEAPTETEADPSCSCSGTHTEVAGESENPANPQ